MNTFTITANIWLYPGASASWHFITIPKKESAEIKKRFAAKQKAWGSLPVTVTLGKTKWSTSIFPDSKSGTYMLPLKAEVRKKEKVSKGDQVTFSLVFSL